MPRLFAERGLNARAESLCLPVGEPCLFRETGGFRPDAEKAAEIIGMAEKAMETEIPLCPASLYVEFAENGNRSNYQAPYFRRRYLALILALGEACEGQGRFSRKLMDVVWAIMEESSWTIPAHLAANSTTHGGFKLPPVYNDERLHAIDLFSAATGAILSAVYYLCKDALDAITPIICEKLKFLVVDRQIKPFLNCVFGWTGFRGNTVNNWNPWIVSNLLLMDAILVDDDYTRRAVVRRSMDCLDNFTAGYAPDGGCNEGPSYWNAAGASYFDCLETLSDLTGGKVDLYGDPLVRAICEYEAKMYINGNRFVNFADCPPSFHPDGSMISRMGKKCGSDLLVAFGDAMAGYGDVLPSTSFIYRGLCNLMTPAHASSGCAGAKRVWFPNLKVMTARENEKTDEGLFVAMKGGHNGESHNHNDVGNIMVYYDGKPVLIDTGCGRYSKKTFSAQRYELWYMQSRYHNLPDIGDFAQLPGQKYRSTDEVYDEETGGVKMQLREAYLPEAGIVSYTRETVLDGKTVRITDDFSLEKQTKVDIHFITHVKPELDEAAHSIALAEGRTLRYDPRLTAGIEEFEATDGLENTWKTPVLWRIHLCAEVKEAAFTTTVE